MEICSWRKRTNGYIYTEESRKNEQNTKRTFKKCPKAMQHLSEIRKILEPEDQNWREVRNTK